MFDAVWKIKLFQLLFKNYKVMKQINFIKAGKIIANMLINYDWYYNVNFTLRIMRMYDVSISQFDKFRSLCLSAYIESLNK